MLFSMTSADRVLELDQVLALRADVEGGNPTRVRADVEIFVAIVVKLTLLAIAMDRYLEEAHTRPTASDAKRRLRWALDQIAYHPNGELAETAVLSELTYVTVASFLGRNRDISALRSDRAHITAAAVTQLGRALGRRGRELDAVVAEIVSYSEFDLEAEAHRARTFWRILDDLEGDPIVSDFRLPDARALEIQQTLAALSNPPSDQQLAGDLAHVAQLDSDFEVWRGDWILDETLYDAPRLSSGPESRFPPRADAPLALETQEVPDDPDDPDGGDYRVWYGTNREPRDTTSRALRQAYSAVFSEDVSMGTCVVRIPRAHRLGSIGHGPIPALLRVVGRDAPLRVVHRESMDGGAFYSKLRDALTEDSEHRLLVYVHGFNTTFDAAAMRTAQIAFDLRFGGPAAFYSWPSKGNPWSYNADLRDADASVELFADFLSNLAARTGVEKLHVIAHSMGNRVLGLTLETIRNRGLAVHFGELVLAAPDLDRNLFKRLARVYPKLAAGTTLYVSRRDQALALSGKLWAGPRVGFHPPVTVAENIDTVDVQSLDLSLLGHGYVSSLSPVLTDIEAVLRGRRPPGTRMRVSASPDGKHWVLR